MPARCVALRVRCPGPLGSCSPVCLLGVLCCVCGVLGHLAPVHWCVRSVGCVACAVSWATWLLLTGVPVECGVARAVFWATWLLFTAVPASFVVFRVPCPGQLGSCSPVCPRGLLCSVCSVLGQLAPLHGCARLVWCWVCGVLGHLAPVHRCTCSVLCFACAVSWATWLLFTSVPAPCVALRVRCPGPLGSRSPVCPLGVFCFAYGVLGHLAPVHRCARSVCCVACAVTWSTWLLFTGAPAPSFVLLVRCPGPLGSCSPVCRPCVLFCRCRVLGQLAPVQRCACFVCCVACAVSWATWILYTGVPALSFALLVRCPGPLGSCSPVCPLGVLLCVCSVLGHVAPVHRCARSRGCAARAVSWATWLLFTGVPARWVSLPVRFPGPLGCCSPVCLLCVLCLGMCVRCCVCGASLRGARSSIWTAAVRSRQVLRTLRARTRSS